MVKKLLIWAALVIPILASAQDGGEYRRRLELGEVLYRKGQYIEAAREFRVARDVFSDGNLVDREQVTFLLARASYMAGEREATGLLTDYCDEFFCGAHYAEAAMLLGNRLLADGQDEAAAKIFDGIDARMLAVDRRDEFRFKLGYAQVLTGQYDKAAEPLVKIDSTSSYYPHAQYLMGYVDYALGRYGEARERFKTVAQAEEFRAAMPYYMMQLDFAQGRWRAVIDNSARAILLSDSERVTEVERMVGTAMYRVRNWNGAAMMLAKYERDNDGFLMRQEQYMLGTAEYMNGGYGAAEPYLLRVIAGDDTLTQNSSYLLGDIYVRLDEKEQAMQSFSVAASMSYNVDIQQDALFNYCKLKYETGGTGVFNEAVNMMNRYLTTYPNSAHTDEIRGYLVAAYYNVRDFEAALKTVLTIKNPNATTRLAMQKILYSRAVERFRVGDLEGSMLLLEQSKRSLADAKYSALADFWEGEILYRRGNYAEAVAKYSVYLKLAPPTEPEAVEAKYNIAYACFNQKKWAEARSWFDAFLTQYKGEDNFTADALNRRGDIEFATKSYWRAIEFYTKAAAYPTDARYYAAFQRAMTLGRVDRESRKIESLNDIIRSNSGDYVDDATYELGCAYMSQKQFGDAARVFEGFLTDFPTSPYCSQVLLNQGLVYINLGNENRALECYKGVLTRERGTETARTALARIREIYTDRGDVDGYVKYAQGVESQSVTEDAAAMAEQIAERQREATERARVEKERADYEAIVASWNTGNSDATERLIQAYNPASNYLKAKSLLIWGDIYLKRGNTLQARATYQSIVDNYPSPSDGIVDEAKARIKALK